MVVHLFVLGVPLVPLNLARLLLLRRQVRPARAIGADTKRRQRSFERFALAGRAASELFHSTICSSSWWHPRQRYSQIGTVARVCRSIEASYHTVLSADLAIHSSPMTRLGRPAVPFRLRDAQGQEHALEDYAKAWLLLVLHRHLR